MHRGIGVAVAASMAVGCGSDQAGDASSEADRSGRGSLEVERIMVDSPMPLDGPIVAVGDVLLTVADEEEEVALNRPTTLLRSGDRGATWERVSLPGGSPQAGFVGSLTAAGDVVAVSGRVLVEASDRQVAAGDAYIWTSRDGMGWTGGRVSGPGPSLPRISVFRAGDVLVATSTSGSVVNPLDENNELELLHSTDDGTTWAPAVLTDLRSQPMDTSVLDVIEQDDGSLVATVRLTDTPTATGPEGASRSRPVLRSTDNGTTWELADCPFPLPPDAPSCHVADRAGDLLTMSEQASLDQGATWQAVSIEGDACPQEPDFVGGCWKVQDVVDLASGGWVATTPAELDSATVYDTLVRSTDGLHWQQIDPPEHCRVDRGSYSTSMIGPLTVGERLVVGYRCYQPDAETNRTELRLLDPEGTTHELIEDSRRDGVTYGQPITVHDGVLVPELDEDRRLIVSLLHLSS